ncbi:hypothetical protein [Streptomyces sp. NBC_01803]|uniref:hypothetical protein n=1 Tax=Streptomyces sp. NBC_01803 TaxID=2975946 RepID=UPI002DD8CA86|nr:hypothetical protein [Streptomyces sp. NBC_01803]WSA44743.1 hypothetical protein OIE51_11330 [Streptomyces sp. NBC_01803]
MTVPQDERDLTARHARDRIRDVLELVGAGQVEVRLERDDEGRTVVRVTATSAELPSLIADLMVKGIVPWPSAGIAVWDGGERRVGEVISAVGPNVRLRSLHTPYEWLSTPHRLRTARIGEIEDAREGKAGHDTVQAP